MTLRQPGDDCGIFVLEFVLQLLRRPGALEACETHSCHSNVIHIAHLILSQLVRIMRPIKYVHFNQWSTLCLIQWLELNSHLLIHHSAPQQLGTALKGVRALFASEFITVHWKHNDERSKKPLGSATLKVT